MGPILANTLGYEFFDVDKKIEASEGKKVIDIFRESGEDYFREVERHILTDLSRCSETVVSLGGGTIADDANFNLVHENGVLVYLELTEEEVFRRVEHRPDRPLLHDEHGNILPHDLLKERIRALMTARLPYYTRADIIIPSHAKRVGRTVDAIVEQLRRIP